MPARWIQVSSTGSSRGRRRRTRILRLIKELGPEHPILLILPYQLAQFPRLDQVSIEREREILVVLVDEESDALGRAVEGRVGEENEGGEVAVTLRELVGCWNFVDRD